MGSSVSGATLAVVPWDHPFAAALRAEQQDELSALYDDDGGAEAELDADQMVATVVVSINGAAVGCGSLRDASAYGDGYGEIKRMFVRPSMRGRGLSRVLLGELERQAVARGMRRLILETGVQQPAAIGLYRSVGYRRIDAYGPWIGNADSLCYARWLDPALATRALLVNGSVGAGKTTTAAAVASLLEERGVPHACVDVDALCQVWPPPDGDRFAQQIALDNLRATARRFVEAGYRRLVVARVVEDQAGREDVEAALDGAHLVAVRVTAGEAERWARLAAREADEASRKWHQARTVELEAVLDAAAIDDAVVDTSGRSPRDVAAEVLARIGW